MLKLKVETVFGKKPLSPLDFDRLSMEIQKSSGSTIGISTLKRIWGYVKSNHTPTYTTLSVLCRYVGYHDFYSFCAGSKGAGANDSGFTEDCVIAVAEEPVGATFRVEWSIGKFCVIKKTAHPSRFEVVEAGNIKLKKGDALSVELLVLGGMFVATECRRDGIYLGSYHGAIKGGIVCICRL